MRVAVLFIFATIAATACDTALTTNLAGLAGGGLDSCAVQSVVITPDTATLAVGQTLQPTAQVQSCTASVDEGVRWVSSNPTIISVDSLSGSITALAAGHASAVASAVAQPTVTASLGVTVAP
jgi:uncharacterized protein YjdB